MKTINFREIKIFSHSIEIGEGRRRYIEPRRQEAGVDEKKTRG